MLSALEIADVISKGTDISIEEIKDYLGITPKVETDYKFIEGITTSMEARKVMNDVESGVLQLSDRASTELRKKWLYLDLIEPLFKKCKKSTGPDRAKNVRYLASRIK